MKRSEMLNTVDQILNDLCHPRHPSYVSRAEMLLGHLEELGMMPPLNENIYHHMDNDHRQEVQAAKFYYQWEEE